METKLLVGFLTLFVTINSSPLPDNLNDSPKCGFGSCHPVKPGYINVHLVPHTHDDVGWLKTVDQYYYGRNNSNLQHAGVQYILDSVTQSLNRNKDRRFIYVETAFFWQWYTKQNKETQNLVKELVNAGRLEFIGGAWSMNDEAAAHYHSIIDQFTFGLKKLNETFGECGRPKIGWQIDPFGHSKEMASIFAQLGFDALFFARIDYQDRALREHTKTTEMVWKADESLGNASNIFTSVLYKHYSAPNGFCFDALCGDDPMIDDPETIEYNVDSRVNDFLDAMEDRHKVFPTNNILVTMGDDFMYQAAEPYFHNIDKLIHHTNLRQKTNGSLYNLIYSTPSCYAKAVYDETQGKNFTTKSDDFFPYGSSNHSYWTGYFTSRPNLKRYEREGNNFLQVCKQLNALNNTRYNANVEALMSAMGILQHHDAVAGTEKQHVARDYARLLHRGVAICESTVFDVLSSFIGNTSADQFTTCSLINISECALSENQDRFIVTVYNPLSRPVTKYVRVPVLGTAYSVRDPQGNNLTVDLVPIPSSVQNIPGRKSNATVDLVFAAEYISPLGFKSYYVQKEEGDHVLKATELNELQDQDIVFFEKDTGLIQRIRMNNVSIQLNHTFGYYSGFVGNNSQEDQRSSGAYVFRPNGTLSSLAKCEKVETFQGKLIFEIHQTFNADVSQIVRIFRNDSSFIELEWLVGPLPSNSSIYPNGKEVVSIFQSNLTSEATFYTDSSGRQMIKRVRNFRPTWNVNLTGEPISGNYYPVNSKIVVRDESAQVQLAVLNDRAQGGSSMRSGEIELMVHRNCFHDDSFGVGEALNETAFGKSLVTRGSHLVVVAPLSGAAAENEKFLAQKKILDSWIFLSSTEESFEEYSQNHNLQFSGLTKPLPKRIQLLSLEKWHGDNQFLMRLEHVFESNEPTELAQPISIDFSKGRFTTFNIESMKETTLGGNQWLEDNTRLQFEVPSEDILSKNLITDYDIQEDLDSLIITMKPHQIRTFIINVQAK